MIRLIRFLDLWQVCNWNFGYHGVRCSIIIQGLHEPLRDWLKDDWNCLGNPESTSQTCYRWIGFGTVAWRVEEILLGKISPQSQSSEFFILQCFDKMGIGGIGMDGHVRQLPSNFWGGILQGRTRQNSRKVEQIQQLLCTKTEECGDSWIHVISWIHRVFCCRLWSAVFALDAVQFKYIWTKICVCCQHFRRADLFPANLRTLCRSAHFFARDPSSFGSTQTASGQGGEVMMMMMMMKLLMVWGMPLARLKSCSIHDARLVNLLQTAGQVSKRMEKLMWRRARESHGSWTDEPEIIGQWLMGDGLVMDILKLSKVRSKLKYLIF